MVGKAAFAFGLATGFVLLIPTALAFPDPDGDNVEMASCPSVADFAFEDRKMPMPPAGVDTDSDGAVAEAFVPWVLESAGVLHAWTAFCVASATSF
jgi:hypothetical protein